MDKTADKKWKCLYVGSALALLVALLLGVSWLMSDAGQQSTAFKKAFAVGFGALSVVGFLVAKIGSWFFHGKG